MITTPALAWDIEAPPPIYVTAGLQLQDEGRVIWEQRSYRDVQLICSLSGLELREGERFYACAALAIVWCIIFIADDLPRWFVPEVQRHEIAHCGGWIHD